jgi:hypothetical protein
LVDLIGSVADVGDSYFEPWLFARSVLDAGHELHAELG